MLKVIIYLILSLVILHINHSAAINCDVEHTSIQSKLMKQLFCNNYDKTQRPVKHHKTTTNITLSLYLKSFSVHEEEPALYLSAWLTVSWKDEFLTWDRADYGLEMINVESSELWRPTVSTYSDKGLGTVDTSCTDHECELKHNGEVSCLSPCAYEARCISTNVDWPFDILNCKLHFSSWLEYASALNITATSNVSTTYLRDHYSWKLLSAFKENTTIDKDNPYPEVNYVFELERHMGLYVAFLTPGFLVVALSLVVLWLNPSSSERLYILCATCMGHFSFIQYLFWHLPYHSEDVPKMLIFFRDSLFINVFLLILTIILKYANPRPHNADGLIDRWALRAASTSVGGILLQRGYLISDNQTQLVEETDTERDNHNHSGNSNGDSINLVMDGSNGNASNGSVKTKDHQCDLVITFIDRIVLICCMLCYVIMLTKLYPKTH